MPIWALLVWLVIGGTAGYFAGSLMGANRPFGIPGDIGLGILGSVGGGWLLGLLGVGGGGVIFSFITALLGAALLIWVVRKVKKVT